MNINASLFGEMIAFSLFVWLTMKFVWPPIMKAIAEREKKIADGLADADRAKQELVQAHDQVGGILKDARAKATDAVTIASQQATQILEDARKQSQAERQRQVEAARAEIQQELNRAKDALRAEVAKVALAAAERIIEREIDAKAHKALLDELAGQIH